MAYNLSKKYNNHYGVDLKSSDLDRADNFASDLLNAQYKKDGSLEKRRGYRVRAASQGGHGLAVYNKIQDDNSFVRELLSVSDKLHRRESAEMVITYSGSADSAIMSVYFDPDTSVYRIQIFEDTTEVLNRSLGVGYDEASIDLLSDLDTAINALTNFGSVITGSTNIPSAFLDLVRDYDLVDGPRTLEAFEWVDVNTPLASPMGGSETNKNSANFENVSFAQSANCLYAANGYDEVHKYDGQNFYRAGLPAGAAPVAASSGGGTGVDAGEHTWKIVYVQKDAVGNLYEGDISLAGSTFTVAGGGEDINVTVTNILASSGFNTNCAIVAGAQVSVNTITVDDGSGGAGTLKVGDTAYFFDTISAAYVERKITGVTATTITIEGAAVSVDDNAVVSNNLRIGIYRTLVGGTFLFQVAEIPNNSFAASQVYLDSTADSGLGIQFIEPIKTRGLPPKGKYIASYYNQLVLTGIEDTPNFFYWTDVTSPEHWPIDENFERAQSQNGGPLTGIKQSNEVLAVFEENATHVYNGDFEANNIRGEIVSHAIGCVAHATLQQVESRLYFLSEKGIFAMVSGQIPQERSNYIQPLFYQDNSTPDFQTYKTKRAVAVADTINERYLCFIPTESTNPSSDVFTNDEYIVLVEDYAHNVRPNEVTNVWLQWRFAGSNPAGGIVVLDDLLYWVERRSSTFNGTVDHNLCQEMNSGDSFDYQDNVSPIEFTYKTNWYSLGEPSVFKRWTRFKVFSINQTSASDTVLTVQTEIDYIKDIPKNEFTIDLNASGAGYGANAYGQGSYGDIDQPNKKSKVNAKAKSMRYILLNSQDQRNIELTGWELEIAAPHLPAIKE